jgi:hypothetical protein
MSAQLSQTMSCGVCADTIGEVLSTATYFTCIGRGFCRGRRFMDGSIIRSRRVAYRG